MRYTTIVSTFAVLLALIAGCSDDSAAAEQDTADASADGGKTAIFAGGCFWCVEQAFDQVAGVTRTVSGYTGGDVENPSYEEVSHGGTGHYEAVKVTYDPGQIVYKQLLTTFWHNVDPTNDQGQFCDAGPQYRSAIFVTNKHQRKLAEASRQALRNKPDAPSPVTTPILDAPTFYPAEAYHQNYYKKNSLRYKFYKNACRREARLEELWGEKAGKP